MSRLALIGVQLGSGRLCRIGRDYPFSVQRNQGLAVCPFEVFVPAAHDVCNPRLRAANFCPDGCLRHARRLLQFSDDCFPVHGGHYHDCGVTSQRLCDSRRAQKYFCYSIAKALTFRIALAILWSSALLIGEAATGQWHRRHPRPSDHRQEHQAHRCRHKVSGSDRRST